jgi:hypothetical protein
MLTTSEQGLADENRRLRERIEALEAGEGQQAATAKKASSRRSNG